jgi:hypothetical protein
LRFLAHAFVPGAPDSFQQQNAQSVHTKITTTKNALLPSYCVVLHIIIMEKIADLIASLVVLLGTAQDPDSSEQDDNLMFDEAPFQEIRQTILSLIQLRDIGDVEDDLDDTPLEEENTLLCYTT